MDNGVQFKDLRFNSRLLLGTGGLTNVDLLTEVIRESGTEIVTVSLRRVGIQHVSDVLINAIPPGVTLLPNTAGCRTAKEAVLTAQMARDVFLTHLIKLEVIGDTKTLLPEPLELLDACEQLANDGFIVLAYTNDDPILADRLVKAGVSSVMPLGSPIGSGLGIRNPHNIMLLVEKVNAQVPIILDAGLGTASDATIAIELGCDGVLVSSAIMRSRNPVQMARAFRLAVQAGIECREAGRIEKRYLAKASTPLEGLAHLT